MTLLRLCRPSTTGPRGRWVRGRLGSFVLTALLLASLMPGLAAAARLLGPLEPAWTLVCTAQGAHWVALDTDDGSTPDSGTAEHCALCRLPAHEPYVPPAQRTAFDGAAAPQAPPLGAVTACPPARRMLLTAAPRAPPRA